MHIGLPVMRCKMHDLDSNKRKTWCVVVADDHGPEYLPSSVRHAKKSPVQYCGFGEPTTLLQRALHRAKQIASAAHIAVTVREEDRERWEPALWFIRPERRFVSDARITASLTTAAALLSIAADSAWNVVTILPARCYVADEGILSAALDRLHETLVKIPEGVGTLGMIDIDDGVDEDYLVPHRSEVGPGLAVQAMARRPAGWIARHLRQQGAMVASGILMGYAGTFAAHIAKHRPELIKALAKVNRGTAGGENQLTADLYRVAPRIRPWMLRWWPPTFPQRAFPVFRCGWRGLHTARAVARISASYPITIDSVPQHLEEPGCQPSRPSSSIICADFAHAADRGQLLSHDDYRTANRAFIQPRRHIDHGWVD
jgi:mannose-1-phosphate guanylyltransferase